MRSFLVTAGFLAWTGLVLAGFGILLRYKSTPGPLTATPRPADDFSLIRLDEARPTLVLFAHPKCPCSRASVGELEEIMARSADNVRAFVVMMQPDGCSTEWCRTPMWDRCAAIRGVTVVADPRGAEAGRRGVKTSGHVLVYGANRALQFSGGITTSRGHKGESEGRRGILSILAGRLPDAPITPVFGCPLQEMP